MHKEFEVHILNEAGITKAKVVALDFDNLMAKLDNYIPQGREFAIVRTKLEEACFFAKKAIANDLANQKQPQLV